jgi:hypothetical protein
MYSMSRTHICMKIDLELSGEITMVEGSALAIFEEDDPVVEEKWWVHEQEISNMRRKLEKLVEEKTEAYA